MRAGVSPFMIDCGDMPIVQHDFSLDAPQVCENAMKIFRAMQLPCKMPILLEGAPGVGKSSLVAAIAKSCGYNLLRINLSDQTDLGELFGTDMPVDN